MRKDEREREERARLTHAGQHVVGADKTVYPADRPIWGAAQVARNQIERGFAEFTAEFAAMGQNPNIAETVNMVFSCLRQLTDLLGLVAGGKEENRVSGACRAFLGATRKMLEILLGLRQELDTAYAAQGELAALKGTDFEEILKIYLARFQKELEGLRQILDQDYRAPEEQARERLSALDEQIEAVERDLLIAQGELEAIAEKIQAVDIAELAQVIKTERPDLDATGQFAEMAKRMAALTEQNEAKRAQEKVVSELETQKSRLERDKSVLQQEIATMERERLVVERQDILPLEDRIAGIERILNPLAVMPETPEVVESPSGAAHGPRSNGSTQLDLGLEPMQAAKAVLVALDIMTSAPFTAVGRSSEVLHIICTEVGIVPQNHPLADFEASMLQLRNLEATNSNFRVHQPPKGFVVYEPTQEGRRVAGRWREEIALSPDLVNNIMGAMERLHAIRPRVKW